MDFDHPSPRGTTRVKICGITTLEDALAAVDAGADALGFMFYPPSPRYIPPDTARRISDALPPFVSRVGVFVDADLDRVHDIARVSGVDSLQFHGKETVEYCRSFPAHRVIKAFRMDGPKALLRLDEFPGLTWLLDSYVAGAFGGTGQTFNWDLACEAVRKGGNSRVILAGGLTTENIARAIAAVRPYAVDVSSGVESAPGRKDRLKLRQFMTGVREA